MGCSLEAKGTGYAEATGPSTADILLVGEALGRQEAIEGRPFVGPSGQFLDRILRRVGTDRDSLRVDNIIRCQPPNDWLVGAPWERDATQRCVQNYLSKTLCEPHKVVVAVGASSTRRLLDLPSRGHKQDNWHGTVNRDSAGRSIVPTYHPAYLLRGYQKLLGVVCFDLQVAKEVAAGSYKPEPAELVVDPPADWFRAWTAEYLEALRLQPERTWLAVDIETDHKSGRNEDELDDVAVDPPVRINFSCHPDVGVTVPWAGQYLDSIRKLLAATGVKCFWNIRFDVPRLRAAGMVVGDPSLDFMWAWHFLQSDVPRGLGFVSPFYSHLGAWKHLSGSDPGRYAAIDAVQTLRNAFGISRDLQSAGQWESFYRHVYRLDTTVLYPAEAIGLLVDQERLKAFNDTLEIEGARLETEIQKLVPESIKPTKIWKRDPGLDGANPVRRTELVQVCKSCSAVEVAKTHRCGDRELKPAVGLEDAQVTRWIQVQPFNPASPAQLLDYLNAKGLKGGKAKGSKTDQESTDKKTLEALAKSTKDPFFNLVLEYRGIEKVRGTYVEGARERSKLDGRLHPQFLHVPSTLRLSCVNPNLQNVTTDRSAEKGSLATGFRRCLVAATGCKLIEVDYSGIEAVETGWYSGDPNYIRLAKLGVHAYLASILIKKPADLKWSDADLKQHFDQIKKNFKKDYDRAKRCVHGTNYGLTPIGMVNNYPEIFDRRSAEATQRLYFEVCPKLAAWQEAVRRRAAKQGFLGGSDHPFNYKHWFWVVYNYNSRTKSWSQGEDSKRCVAYYPQSTAAGVVKEAALALVNPEDPGFIGDLYFGRTPIRALVHDSILVEVPDAKVEEARAKMTSVMERPIRQQPMDPSWGLGEFLQIGVEPKIGSDWMMEG